MLGGRAEDAHRTPPRAGPSSAARSPRPGHSPRHCSAGRTRMLQPPLSRAPIVEDWLQRHRHPGSFVLHILGIPPTLIGALMVPIAVAALSWPVFLFSLSLFVAGYLLQFLGHALE